VPAAAAGEDRGAVEQALQARLDEDFDNIDVAGLPGTPADRAEEAGVASGQRAELTGKAASFARLRCEGAANTVSWLLPPTAG
jgi:hypothetical protein